MTTWVRLAALVLLLLAGAAVLVLVPLPGPEELRDRVAATPWAPLVFVAGYVVATVLILPKNVLSAAAGLAFGLAGGVLLVWVGAMLGASVSFWLGRRLGRDGVARLTGRHLARLDDLVLRHGTVAVLVARLVPVVPFTAVNYGSGLTAVPFGRYLLATGIGIVPGTIAYVAYVAVGAYGAQAAGWQFLSAVGVLLVLSVGGAWWGRRRWRTAGARRSSSAGAPASREG